MPRPRRNRPAFASARASRAPARSPSAESLSDRGHTRTGRLSRGEEDRIQAANRNRDAALERLANKDATTASSGNERDVSPKGTMERERRVLETPAHPRDTTGLDLADDSIFGDLDDSFANGEIPQGLLSNDTSIISLSNFRSRSRQSSFIGRNDPPIRPSSRGGNTPGIGSSFNIGAFRRRPREPSILGTSRKPLRELSQAAQVASVESGSVSGSESEDDFEPEAESTPLNNRRKTRQSHDFPQAPPSETPELSSSRKRKNEDESYSSARPDKTPRTDQADQHMDSGDSGSELSDAPSPPKSDQDSESELSVLSSPREPPGFFRRPVTPINDDEINAPPASSDSESGNEIWPDIRALAKKRRRPSLTSPTKLNNLSDISSPPSLTHSPNFEDARGRSRARGIAQQQQQSPIKLTTADLTNLLPKRRYKKARDPLSLDSDEELDATGLGDEDDELSYLDTQAARRKKGSRPPSRATSASRDGRATKSGSKSRRTQASGKAAVGRSHSSNKDSDAGNGAEDGDVEGDEEGEEEGEGEEGESRFVPLADDTFDAGASTPSVGTGSADELKRASKKFKEVDKWELDFEEVTETSSPQDGR